MNPTVSTVDNSKSASEKPLDVTKKNPNINNEDISLEANEPNHANIPRLKSISSKLKEDNIFLNHTFALNLDSTKTSYPHIVYAVTIDISRNHCLEIAELIYDEIFNNRYLTQQKHPSNVYSFDIYGCLQEALPNLRIDTLSNNTAYGLSTRTLLNPYPPSPRKTPSFMKFEDGYANLSPIYRSVNENHLPCLGILALYGKHIHTYNGEMHIYDNTNKPMETHPSDTPLAKIKFLNPIDYMKDGVIVHTQPCIDMNIDGKLYTVKLTTMNIPDYKGHSVCIIMPELLSKEKVTDMKEGLDLKDAICSIPGFENKPFTADMITSSNDNILINSDGKYCIDPYLAIEKDIELIEDYNPQPILLCTTDNNIVELTLLMHTDKEPEGSVVFHEI